MIEITVTEPGCHDLTLMIVVTPAMFCLSSSSLFLFLCVCSFVCLFLSDLDEDALDYACGLLCNPETTHAHVSSVRIPGSMGGELSFGRSREVE